MAMEAISALRRLKLIPRRTIRVVLWTNEENGLGGARAYAKAHRAELARHVAAIEADTGAFAPRGFGLALSDKVKLGRAAARLRRLMPLLAPLGATEVEVGYAGADVWPLRRADVPRLGLRMDISTYFDYHHTRADTLDKVDPALLSKDVATLAAMAYVLAEMPGRLDDRGQPD